MKLLENKALKNSIICVVIILSIVLGYWLADQDSKVELVWTPIIPTSRTQTAYAGTGAEMASNTNNILTPVILTDNRVFCPVCYEKGLKSCVYVGHTTGTLVWNQPWYDEEGNYHYEDTNTYTTHYSCSKGHKWYESRSGNAKWGEITKDTENEIIEMEELEDVTLEKEFIEFGLEGEVVITLAPMTSMTFGGDVGKISWDDGLMIFEGNAAESAKIFFEDFLKVLVDKYIESELNKEEEVESTIELGEQILYQYVTSGKWKDTFKPQWFLKVVDTDLSRCLIDGRLRLNLDGEIYWIRLEKDVISK